MFMNKKPVFQSVLTHLAAEAAPQAKTDLWPSIRMSLVGEKIQNQLGTPGLKPGPVHFKRWAPGLALFAIILLGGAVFFAIPQGRAWAQGILHFFTRAAGDRLPVQPWQLTPLPTPGTPSPDPANIEDADLSVAEVKDVAAQAGYAVLVPGNLPDRLVFAGASIEDKEKIVRIFYRYVETNGLVFRQEPLPAGNACELCGQVGESAAIVAVEVNGNPGEYVEGMWNLTDSGPVWSADPYLKTMRWQTDAMAFELMYMGPPETLSQEEMIAIAESLR
jgi:hypothetical protein